MTDSVYDPPQTSLQTPVQVVRKKFRWKTGLALFVIGAIGTIIVNRSAASDTDKVIRTYEGAGITLLALGIWWCFFSGIRLWVRLLTVTLAIAILVGGAMLSVRRVDFTGDMRPKFWFVWDPPSPSEKAQEWLNQHAPQNSISAIPPTPEDEVAASPDTTSRIVITAADWPQNCGRNGSREINEPQCSFDWGGDPPRELWRHPVGDAWSSFTIVGATLFTQEQRGASECVVCYNTDTGKEL